MIVCFLCCSICDLLADKDLEEVRVCSFIYLLSDSWGIIIESRKQLTWSRIYFLESPRTKL